MCAVQNIFSDAETAAVERCPTPANEINNGAATKRLAEYLAEAGVRVNVRPGFKVVDVHTRYLLTSDLGRIRLKGKTDAIVTTTDQADIHAHIQGRIIVDFQTLCPALPDVEGQSLAELAAASSISVHDVMVVFMDLNSRAHIWRPEGHKLNLWQDCSTKQAISIMADFLNTMCAPTSVLNAEAAEVPGPPEEKRARKEFVDRMHGLVPTNQALLDQLEAFVGMGDEGWMAAREVVYSAMGGADGSHLSYYS